MPTKIERGMDAGLARIGLPRRGAVRAWRPLAEAMRDREPAFVLAHNGPTLPRLLRDQPHTTVLYAHNDLLRTVGTAEARRGLGAVGAIVCVSADLAEVMASRLPAEFIDRIHVVPNGVDTKQFSPASRVRTNERLRVMFVGRTLPEKGPHVLLEAARRLQRDDLEVLIVGSGGFAREAPLTPYERSLRRLAADIPHARFEPFVDRERLPGLLREADIFVAPSRWREPSGLTVGEALATGLPVIASRVGGIAEVTGDAAVLVDPDNPQALADALEHFADDPAARDRHARAAREHALAHSWRESWAALRETLESLEDGAP
ncbi:glycosyltransferase family 4 protein [Humibacter sp. RRB41]|uniref:glycosyltransferase family 4 protein n=1 Tax=Humibacter sp. RRB41 TaxID=2919946 RepID=UPI0027E385F2|nr:glycosyltransferase family 4 protein [Humibacter sp. RRB41]